MNPALDPVPTARPSGPPAAAPGAAVPGAAVPGTVPPGAAPGSARDAASGLVRDAASGVVRGLAPDPVRGPARDTARDAAGGTAGAATADTGPGAAPDSAYDQRHQPAAHDGGDDRAAAGAPRYPVRDAAGGGAYTPAREPARARLRDRPRGPVRGSALSATSAPAPAAARDAAPAPVPDPVPGPALDSAVDTPLGPVLEAAPDPAPNLALDRVPNATLNPVLDRGPNTALDRAPNPALDGVLNPALDRVPNVTVGRAPNSAAGRVPDAALDRVPSPSLDAVPDTGLVAVPDPAAGFARQTFALWGGEATLLVADPGRLAAARRAVDGVIAAVDLACSGYRDDSELVAVNAAAGGPVRVSALFAEVLRASLRAARLTGGLVDPTAAGPLLTDRADHRAGAWEDIRLDAAAGTVTIAAGTALDLGAIGKAFAADRAADAALRAAGCGVLVGLGGDIAAAGPVPAGGWPVRVADDHRGPLRGALPYGQDIALPAAGGLATSSLAVRRRRMRDGRTVSHIVDPRNGMPVRGPWLTVSVAAGTCVDANTASTAAIVRGGSAGGWLARRRLPARLVHGDGWVHTVAAWPDDHSERPGVKVAG